MWENVLWSDETKAERIKNIRAARDSEIDKLTKEKDSLKSKIEKAREEVAKKKSPNKAEVTKAATEIKNRAKREIAEVTNESRREIAQAKNQLKQVQATPPKPKTRPKPQKKGAAKHMADMKDSAEDSFNTLKPIKSEGEVTKSKMQAKFAEQLKDIRAKFGDDTNEWPDEFRQMGMKQATDNAIDRVVKNPAETYNDFLKGKNFADTPRANVAAALLQHPFVKGNPIRVDAITRMTAREGTRLGQELVGRKILYSLQSHTLNEGLFRKAEDILKKRGIDISDEAKKAMKELGEEYDTIAAASDESVAAFIRETTCKV